VPSTRPAPIPAQDEAIATAARRVRILGSLTWPLQVETRFLARWRAGDRALPQPPAVEPPPSDPVFTEAPTSLDRADPVHAFVARTADSYARAQAMLAAAGTRAFTEHSSALYGHPDDELSPGGPTVRDEAEHLLQATEAMADVPSPPKTMTSAQAQQWLQERIDDQFDDPLPVELDPELASLASASSRRLRLRDGERWSEVQVAQLLFHEALVHTATKRNGRSQPLACLGLSSPRTTTVQEGLATFAELITDTLDLARLRRVALRVKIVDQVLDGADFVEVFEGLLDDGQEEHEAFRTAQRVFRGGDVRGGVAFTKDVVYLRGLREVHGFLLASLRAHRPELCDILFAGRMTAGDALALAPRFADGTLHAPVRRPGWLQATDRLAAYLAWAAFGQGVEARPLDSFR